MQIPNFPEFTPISLASRQQIENAISKFPPYSDFNFISMHSWNVKENMLTSQLNENLVIQFRDYTSDKVFLSFIGDSMVDSTIKTLLEYASSKNLHHELHLVPEHTIARIKQPEQFIITEDRDNHDYVVLAIELSELKGAKHASKRHGVNKFLSHTQNRKVELKKIELNTVAISDILGLFHQWKNEAGKHHSEIKDELEAIQRLANNAHNFNLNNLAIYVDDVLVAYSLYEIRGAFAVGHFEKALKSQPGLYDYLKHSTAKDLHRQGVDYINYEQDLGIEGLRKSKLLLHPEKFLKKYTVSLKT